MDNRDYGRKLGQIHGRLFGWLLRRALLATCLWYGTNNGWLTAAGVLAFHYMDKDWRSE